MKLKNLIYALSFTLIMGVGSHSVFAQSWPVNSPDVYEAVPQYGAARYPLGNASETNSPPGPLNEVVGQPFEMPSIKNVAPQPASVAPDPKSDSSTDAHPQKNWDIYRDRNTYPIDPRKPCNICTQPSASQPRCNSDLPGIKGRPYFDSEPGGCRCESKNPGSHPEFSVNWPRPFSAKLDERNPQRAAARYAPCQKKRIVDAFDSLSTFKLSKYQRTDNGYCGPGSDPYGCLGESKQQPSGVAGVGYRFPSEPVSRGIGY